jgi:hypothetical protein
VFLKGPRDTELNWRVVHNLPAAASWLVTGLVGSVGPSDFHLFGPLNIYATNKQFATDANMKQAVTSCVQTLDIKSPPFWDKRVGVTV